MSKYDWLRIKTDYIKNKYKSLKDIAEIEQIPYGLVRKKCTGWNKIGTKIEDKAIEKTAELIAKMRARQIEIGTKMQKIGMETLENSDEITDSDAINAIRVGSTMEREILQPEQKSVSPVTIVFQSAEILNRPYIEAKDVTCPKLT